MKNESMRSLRKDFPMRGGGSGEEERDNGRDFAELKDTFHCVSMTWNPVCPRHIRLYTPTRGSPSSRPASYLCPLLLRQSCHVSGCLLSPPTVASAFIFQTGSCLVSDHITDCHPSSKDSPVGTPVRGGFIGGVIPYTCNPAGVSHTQSQD